MSDIEVEVESPVRLWASLVGVQITEGPEIDGNTGAPMLMLLLVGNNGQKYAAFPHDPGSVLSEAAVGSHFQLDVGDEWNPTSVRSIVTAGMAARTLPMVAQALRQIGNNDLLAASQTLQAILGSALPSEIERA